MNTMFGLTLCVRGLREGDAELADVGLPATAVRRSDDLSLTTLLDGALIVLGDAFPSSGHRGDLDGLASGDPVERLKLFARSHWGRFIAIAEDRATSRVALYRDPSAMVPCYYMRRDDRLGVGTDARDILDRVGCRAEIDWTGIANCLIADDYRGRRTAVKGICELLPGECVVVSQDGEDHDQLWSPACFLKDPNGLGFVEASEVLRGELERVIDCWVGRYSSPLIAVSGGFDSSAIAALAARSGRVDLVHFFTTSLMADERQHANGLASHLDLALPAVLSDVGRVIIGDNHSKHRPRPSARLFTQIFDEVSSLEAKRTGAKVHFNGGGGDSVFGKIHSAYPLADRYLQAGLSRDMVTSALDICGATGASLKDVLVQAVKALRGRGMPTVWPQAHDLLSSEAIAAAEIGAHPWLDGTRGALPGQRQYVRSLARATATTDYLNIRDPLPTIYPVLSQPILELCLSIPSWFWFSEGRDRSLARASLAPYLPPAIVNRTSKGAFDGLLHQLLDRHRIDIVGELQTGILAQQGLVDSRAIAAYRSDPGLATATRILHLYEVQTWCTAWAS